MDDAEEVLAQIESIGGSYVWEPEVFAITLLQAEPTNDDVSCLGKLAGVDQIAINAERLSFEAIKGIAAIEGLESLVLQGHHLTDAEVSALRSIGPKIELIEDEG